MVATTRRRARSLSSTSAVSDEGNRTVRRRATSVPLSSAECGGGNEEDGSVPASSDQGGQAIPQKGRRDRTRSRGNEEDLVRNQEKPRKAKDANFEEQRRTDKIQEDSGGDRKNNDTVHQLDKKETDDRSGHDEDSDEDVDLQSGLEGNRGPGQTACLVRNKTTSKVKERNALTHIIPGYTAPMKLNTFSLDKYRPTGGIRELQRRAERTDASTKDFVLEATAKHTQAMQKTSGGFLPKSYTAAYSSFKRGTRRAPDNTAGKGWFGMAPTEMTEELKTDLAVIRNRSYLDPKRFYKSADKHHKIVQLGTVIEGPSEYFSSRLTKKQRRSNFTEEIMADPSSADYTRNKFKTMSREKNRKAEMRKLKPKRVKKFY